MEGFDESALEQRMEKSFNVLITAFARVRTGRAHPSFLDVIKVDYYGNLVPINQVANVTVEDARTLSITPWEKPMVSIIEKEILKSELGVTPNVVGQVIRLVMPQLTEENRKNLVKLARNEAEQAKVSMRNIRRDTLSSLKSDEYSEDDVRKISARIQKIIDQWISKIDDQLKIKESDLMVV